MNYRHLEQSSHSMCNSCVSGSFLLLFITLSSFLCSVCRLLWNQCHFYRHYSVSTIIHREKEYMLELNISRMCMKSLWKAYWKCACTDFCYIFNGFLRWCFFSSSTNNTPFQVYLTHSATSAGFCFSLPLNCVHNQNWRDLSKSVWNVIE